LVPLVRPAPTEYTPYYASYVEKVPVGDILHILAQQGNQTLALLSKVAEERAEHRYAPDKWSLKEVVGHLLDTERLFTFRALWFARQDPSPQPGMDQDDWITAGRFHQRSLADLLSEYRTVRTASLALFRGFTPRMWLRRGVANNVEFTVRTFPFIIAGHERHHVQVLQEKYL